jgi:hypothetical protein
LIEVGHGGGERCASMHSTGEGIMRRGRIRLEKRGIAC